jgi:hypothetical protein
MPARWRSCRPTGVPRAYLHAAPLLRRWTVYALSLSLNQGIDGPVDNQAEYLVAVAVSRYHRLQAEPVRQEFEITGERVKTLPGLGQTAFHRGSGRAMTYCDCRVHLALFRMRHYRIGDAARRRLIAQRLLELRQIEDANEPVAQIGELSDPGSTRDQQPLRVVKDRRAECQPYRVAIVGSGEMVVANWIVPACGAANASGSAGNVWIFSPSALPRMAMAAARQLSPPRAERLPCRSVRFQSSASDTTPQSSRLVERMALTVTL